MSLLKTNINFPVLIWSSVLLIFLCSLVLVGGGTRLTDSGLSITEWEVFIGIFPPLSHESWINEFDKYKNIPEYILVNNMMPLEEFKTIYLWEWAHRFLARIVGVLALIPFFYFLIKNKLSRAMSIKSVLLIFLIGLQGYIGWYMVQSGLIERIDVSQYRLSMHLTIAFVIILVTLLLIFESLDLSFQIHKKTNKIWPTFLFLSIFLQLSLGGLVSGLDAGLVYPSWPLMGNTFVPEDYWIDNLNLLNFFENRTNVQFNHRIMGYLIFFLGVINVFISRKIRVFFVFSLIILLLIIIQILFGIISLVNNMPWQTAIIHQFFSIVLFISASFYAYLSYLGK
jgi:cytochrome c oxidase assembly protein subunit 15